jgi:purine-nucleoside/S-methyl-5'-thioadenosine phosphorylase / adenosine deaminase
MVHDWIVPAWPAPAAVRAVTTTRHGGVSVPPWDSMNPADHVGDQPGAVAENRARLSRALQLPAAPVWLQQVHGVGVVNAAQVHGVPAADAAWTAQAGVVCAVMTADCLPVLLCDRAGQCVAAAHAGWRGLAAGVLEQTVQALPARPEALLAWLGPAIGPAAYVVGAEVRDAFLASDADAADAFTVAEQGGWHADLYRLARLRLSRLGVSAVFGGDWCSFTAPERFYSYRREGVTGRMASLIWLAGE